MFATVLLRGCIACLGFAIFFLYLFAKALFSFFSIHTHCHLFQFFMFKINRNRLDTRTSAGVSEGSKLSGTKILGLGGPATRQIYLWEIHVRHVHYIDENICTLLSHQYTYCVHNLISYVQRQHIYVLSCGKKSSQYMVYLYYVGVFFFVVLFVAFSFWLHALSHPMGTEVLNVFVGSLTLSDRHHPFFFRCRFFFGRVGF